jgi:hypothetical protein
VTFSFEPAQPGHVLENLARSIGPIPRVLLPETGADPTALTVTEPSTDEMPAPAVRGDRYQLFGEIARGGMGAVLRGRDPDLGRDLAVKVSLESHEDKPGGLSGGSSLARLFAEHRGVRNRNGLPSLAVSQILGWADAYRARTGSWPSIKSGPVVDAPGESWNAISQALRKGLRGLPGGSSLARLLEHEREMRNPMNLPPLRIPEILAWAEAHRAVHGRWPLQKSGPIPQAPGETWQRVDKALRRGLRGLPNGSSLSRLLAARATGAHS